MENEAGETLMAFPTGQWGPQAWHDDLMFHQPEVDACCAPQVERLPGVELRPGTTLQEIEQDGARVALPRQHRRRRIRGRITARWVIAADGATSTVRRLLGIANESLGTDDPWLVVDGHLRDAPGLAGDMTFLGHHTRPALWVRLPGDRVRMEFKVMPGDDPAEIATPEAIARISRGVLPLGKFEPDRTAIYTFRARVAEKWRVGNVFLAGDAAHQAPPLFGQGLCSGLRDVANLVWKLRLVSQGLAAEELLDTYESERRPHARYWVEKAASMAGLMQTTDPETAAGRDAYLRANPAAAAPPSAPPLGPGLHTGARDERAGRLSVQPVLPDGRTPRRPGRRPLPAGHHSGTARGLATAGPRRRRRGPGDRGPHRRRADRRAARARPAQAPWWSAPTATSSALADTAGRARGAAAPRPDRCPSATSPPRPQPAPDLIPIQSRTEGVLRADRLITHLRHVDIAVPDYEKQVAFYARPMGPDRGRRRDRL